LLFATIRILFFLRVIFGMIETSSDIKLRWRVRIQPP
jgi:hypothetical protein